MAALVAAIHVLLRDQHKDVDGRHKAGHDAERRNAQKLKSNGRANKVASAPSNQGFVQIIPFGVHGHYEPYFPGSGPMFDAAFALNGRPNIVVKFKPDEPLEAIALCKSLDESVPMFERASRHVVRHAGV
jgi:hypothetical protein